MNIIIKIKIFVKTFNFTIIIRKYINIHIYKCLMKYTCQTSPKQKYKNDQTNVEKLTDFRGPKVNLAREVYVMSSFTGVALRRQDTRERRRTNYIKGPHTVYEEEGTSRRGVRQRVARAKYIRLRRDYAGGFTLRPALNRSFRMKRIGGSTASSTWVVARDWAERVSARVRGFRDSSRFNSSPHLFD